MDKILIVDDVNLNLRILEDLLKDQYIVIKAHNGKEALEIAHNDLPKVILMDIVMPEMDGIEATKLLKRDEKTAHIPIIFITALDNIAFITQGFEVGGVDYIIKPYKPQEVLLRINTQIQLIEYQQQILELTKKNSILAMIVTTNHELRQPLTRLKGFFDLHLEELANGSLAFSKKNIAKIDKAINEMISILDKYQNNPDFDITSYLTNTEYNMDIKMVHFNENKH